jgi:hypothetical protein
LTDDDALVGPLAFSATAAVILVTIVLLNSGEGGGESISSSARIIVGFAFTAVSALGVSMAIWPNWRRAPRRAGRSMPVSDDPEDGSAITPRRRGHHPECEPFANHTILIGGRVRCGGCIGLAIGAVIAIALMLAYVAFPAAIPSEAALPFFLASAFPISLGLLAAGSSLVGSGLHFVLNVLFVIGFFMVVVAALLATGEMVVGLYAVATSVLWMQTRVHLSRRNHIRTCAACPSECKAYL